MTDPFSATDLKKIQKRVSWTATSRFLTPSDVQDIVGDVLLAAVRTAPRAELTIAAAAIGNTKRTRYVTRKVKEAKPYAESYRFGVPSVGDDFDAGEADNAVLRNAGYYGAPSDAELAIRDLIRRLPVEQAQAFTLCGEYGYTLQQAAAMLGVSPSTVDRNLKRARATLQSALLIP